MKSRKFIRRALGAAGFACVLVSVLVSCTRAQTYDPVCKPLQLGTLKPSPCPIDTGKGTSTGEACLAEGTSGSGTPPAELAAPEQQNRVKNNFCAPSFPPNKPTTTNAMTVDFSTFQKLQDIANNFDPKEVEWGTRDHLPKDRSKLKNLSGLKLGESDLVTLVAFVRDAGHSDVSLNPTPAKPGGEGVNCNFPRCIDNDVHIALVQSPGDDECTSVTAEIVPHFRPAVWELFDSPDFATHLRTHPVKITGQLFFDASHRPCKGNVKIKADKAHGIAADPAGGNPARMTVWEIHPVYSIFVCNSQKLSQCKADVASAWRPFDEMPAIVGKKLSAIEPGVLKGTTQSCPKVE